MKSKNEVSICRCKLLLSDIYTLQNRLSLATQFAEEGLILASKLELNREQGWALHNLGIIHDRINDYVRARFFYERAINAYKTSDYDNVDLLSSYNKHVYNAKFQIPVLLKNKNFFYIPNTFIENIKKEKKSYKLITDKKKNIRFKI